MSVEITLYQKKATKNSLLRFLKVEGFQKVKHFLDQMNTPDQLYFWWYGVENYESADGVEATVYKVSPEIKEKFGCSEWILHTRTRSSGSHEDKKKQNDVIRKARSQFGGTFYNDWYGTNRYTDLMDYNKFSPLEKGISIVASNALEKLRQIADCLIGYSNEFSESISEITLESLKASIIFKDPSIVLYNSLMPFLVSVIEYFYGQCFAIFIKYNSFAKKVAIEQKTKIGIEDVADIIEKKITLEQIVTKSFNFQNLDSINKTYQKFLEIDIRATLSKKKKINKKIVRVLPTIERILEARHKFVHELDIDYSLTKQIYLDYVATVEMAINLTLDSFKAKGLRIEIDY